MKALIQPCGLIDDVDMCGLVQPTHWSSPPRATATLDYCFHDIIDQTITAAQNWAVRSMLLRQHLSIGLLPRYMIDSQAD
jgi:hypothetical protein